MVQDHDGFIWFGTETGLSRFDGTQFKNFTVADGLADNEIVRLFVDSRNRVWLMPFARAICYYWNGSIYNSSNDSQIKQLNVTSFIHTIVENDRGDIAIVQEKRISILKANGTIINIEKAGGMPFAMTSVAGIKDKSVFLFSATQSAGTLNIYEYYNDSMHIVKSWSLLPKGRYPIHFSHNLEIVLEAVPQLLLGTSDSGSFQLPAGGFLRAHRLNDSQVVFNWSTHVTIYNIYRKKTERTIFKGKNVNTFLEDREHNWWFSTMGEGVYQLPSTEMKNYFFEVDNYAFPVTALEKYKDTLYVGTDHLRLWTVDLKRNRITSRQVASGPTAGRVTTLNRIHSGSLWAGTDRGLHKVLPDKIIASGVINSVKSTYVFNDTLVAATSWDCFVVETIGMRLTDKMLIGRTTAVLRKDHKYYIGTLSGLLVIPENGKSQFLGGLHPALAGRISAIRATKNGVIWVATYGFGIIGLQNDSVVATINVDNGLTSNICRCLYIKDDILWIGTDKGLNKLQFDGGKWKIKKYTTADGLASDMINAVFYDGHTVFAGTPAGITFFEEEKVFTHSICNLKITGIQTPERRWQRDTSGLQFKHAENDIRIEFAGISFRSGGDILYRYRLNGLDETWRETRDNFLNFLSLPSGDYELELNAINKFGVQSKNLYLRFSVAKLIWEKNWFRLLVLVLLAIAVWLFVRYRTLTIRREVIQNIETNRKITGLEQMALKAQMNPHFIFNSLHAIQQYVIDRDVAGANKYITDFARLIRLTLDISSQAKISLSDEINFISTYFELEKAKYEGKFDYRVETSGEIDEHSLYIPVMLLQPYIENSIRHGIYYRTDNKGMIVVNFHLVNEYLVCIIEDNGVGRKASEQFKSNQQAVHQSKGMSITAKRIDMLNQDYIMPIFTKIEDVYDGTGPYEVSGTRVILRFPLQEVKKQG